MRRFFIFIIFLPVVTTAQLRVAPIFSDNMMLQREKPVRVWGKGTPGQEVHIAFGNERRVGQVKADSTWHVSLSKRPASMNPQAITIQSAGEEIQLNNLLVGDVWLCIGQSNMEWPLIREQHFKETLASGDQPLLRFYNPTYAGKNIYGQPFRDSTIRQLNAEHFYRGEWETCNQHSIEDLSAVAYYFATKIIRHENIPVGLIHLAIGGAPIETFIDREAMRRRNRFASKVTGNWLTNDALPVWVRERGQQNVGDRNGVSTDDLGPDHAYKPGFAFARGIQPITSLALKGILWYQGESNAQELQSVNEYGALQQLMVEDYRQRWNDPSLPFYFVQLSSIDTIRYKGQLWPALRDEQRKSLDEIKFSGMAVCSDIGDKNDVHPRNKKTVGERLARWALNKTYGNKAMIPSGPLPVKARYRKGEVVITFRYAKGLTTPAGELLKGFSIDGKNPAQAIITGNTVTVTVPEKPQSIYYGWTPFTEANLHNRAGLPASTFKLNVQ